MKREQTKASKERGAAKWKMEEGARGAAPSRRINKKKTRRKRKRLTY